MAVQFTTATLMPTPARDSEPIRTLVPVDFAEPTFDPELAHLAAREAAAAELGWNVIARLERAGMVLLSRDNFQHMAAGLTRLKSLQIGEYLFDLDMKRLLRNEIEINLTPTEWALAELLVRRVDRVVTHAELLRRIWGAAYVNESHLLRVNMARLRAKMEPEHTHYRDGGYQIIRTRPGVGYFLAGENRQP